MATENGSVNHTDRKKGSSKNLEKICRSEAEAGLGFLMHFLLLLYYIGVHAYNFHLFRACDNPDKYYPGSKYVGGELRYLTNITLASAC